MIYKREDYTEEASEESRFPVKNIEVLTPVEDGQTRYFGQVALGVQTPAGLQQVPISFEIDATSIQEAFQKFAPIADEKIDEARKKIEEEFERIRDQASSRIIRPGEAGLPGGAPGMIDISKLKQ